MQDHNPNPTEIFKYRPPYGLLLMVGVVFFGGSSVWFIYDWFWGFPTLDGQPLLTNFDISGYWFYTAIAFLFAASSTVVMVQALRTDPKIQIFENRFIAPRGYLRSGTVTVYYADVLSMNLWSHGTDQRHIELKHSTGQITFDRMWMSNHTAFDYLFEDLKQRIGEDRLTPAAQNFKIFCRRPDT